MSVRLVDLNPHFVGRGGPGITRNGKPVPHQEGVGMTFDCPCGSEKCERVYLEFENPLEGEHAASEQPRWHRTGSDFESMTLRPSIRRMGTLGNVCQWHGFLTDGVLHEC